MTALRHLFLALLLVAAQLAASVHALEHTLSDDDNLPPHACTLCLQAHDLGNALPALAPALPVPPSVQHLHLTPPTPVGALVLPTPRQGAPPTA